MRLTRMTPALLVLTVVMSTASVALPVVKLPGSGPHGVTAEVVRLPLDPGELVDRVADGSLAGDLVRASTPVREVADFSLLGVTWRSGTSPDGSFTVSARTRAGGSWSSWTKLDADSDSPDEATTEAAADRAGTAPLWVDRSEAFQVRVDVRAGHLPRGLAVLLVDPGRSPADAAVGGSSLSGVVSTAHAHIKGPTIHRRKEWGADEDLRGTAPKLTGPIKAAFVHHTAGDNDYSAADVPKILRAIYAYHVKGRGWSDIGYNFLVDRFGRIWEGRAGGIDEPVQGAHTRGFNTDTFGVAALGNFETAEPTPAMIAGIADVIAWKFSRYGSGAGLDPKGMVTLRSGGGDGSRFGIGRKVRIHRVSGHRDAGFTACPGENLYDKLPRIRAVAHKRINEESTHGSLTRAAAG